MIVPSINHCGGIGWRPVALVMVLRSSKGLPAAPIKIADGSSHSDTIYDRAGVKSNAARP
jgi:hypothetical protein